MRRKHRYELKSILWHRSNWELSSQKHEKMIFPCEVQYEDGKIIAVDFEQCNFISNSLFYKQPLLNAELYPPLLTAGFKKSLLKFVIFLKFGIQSHSHSFSIQFMQEIFLVEKQQHPQIFLWENLEGRLTSLLCFCIKIFRSVVYMSQDALTNIHSI